MTFALTLGPTELAIGMIQGLCYALLGLGLVLVYRASRVIHFGYGEVGALGAVILAKLVLDGGWPWWLAIVVVVAGGAALGAGWELTVVRRLMHRPRVALMVATIAIAQLMLVLQLLVPPVSNQGLFPTALDIRQPLGDFVLRGDHIAVLLVVPAVAIALAWFLNRSMTGLAIRGAAANLDAASLAGVHVKRVSTIVWALTGALATLTFVLVLPVRGYVFGATTEALGPALLLRALVVGLVGRMVSLPLTVAGGIGLGVVESVLLSNIGSPGAVDMMLFVVLLVLLVVRGASTQGSQDASFVPAVRRLADQLRGRPMTRHIPAVLASTAILFAVVAPFLTESPGRQLMLTKIIVFAIAGLSVVVVTGWAGQLSLCQFALVGLGAFATAGLTTRGMDFGPAAALAIGMTAACALLVGFPALRIRGLFLAMATLGFAVAAQAWLLKLDVFQDPLGAVVVQRDHLGPLDLTNQRVYYFLCLTALLLAASALVRLRRSGVGLAILAVRDNEPAASAVTLSPATVKLTAFGLSGALAGLAGALLGGLLVDLNVNDIGPEQSVLLLTMAIIGGVGSVAGAILGAVYLIGLPGLFADSMTVMLLTSGAGLLAVVIWSPGGLVELAQRGSLRLLGGTGPLVSAVPTRTRTEPSWPEGPGQSRSAVPGPRIAGHLPVPARSTVRLPEDVPILSCCQVDVRFGGVHANRSIDLEVPSGQVVGLIGTNGAGKSTLLNAIAGAVPLNGGAVSMFGVDVTGWPVYARADLGVGRIFQDARLFEQLTAHECVLVALEARRRSEVLPSLLGLPPARLEERTKRAVADELIDLFGLGPHAHLMASELSTGMRRILELASLIASGGTLLLLDEPTAGVAQREVEAFAAVIQAVQRALGATLVIIEHDMPLVMGLCDRIVCLSAGEVIADGAPKEIRTDPAVIASYLGTDDHAIARSGPVGAR
jgi:ABC-type branched-subunit amino acid transport system ATPase component/ABC-type branched-subunit amino acid transport system permease subunit